MVKKKNSEQPPKFIVAPEDGQISLVKGHGIGRSDVLSYVQFDAFTDPSADRPDRIEVSMLRTPPQHRGKGYARKVMQRLYDEYPQHFIDWGHTMHPAATKLAQDFENQYYDRTAYEIPHDEEFRNLGERLG